MSRKKATKTGTKGTTKVPAIFKVKGHSWTVDYKWGYWIKTGNPGGCDFNTRTITLDRAMDKEDKWSIFCHELKHAILFEAHLNEASGLHPKPEEIICDAFEEFVTSNWDVRWKRGVTS